MPSLPLRVPDAGRQKSQKGTCVPELLKYLGQFSGESAFWFHFALAAAAAFGTVDSGAVGSLFRFGGTDRTSTLHSNTFRWLRGVGSKDFIFERGSVKSANDGLHLVRCWRLDKRESFRFLRLVVPDHLNRIRDKVFSCEPLFNVVRSDPYG